MIIALAIGMGGQKKGSGVNLIPLYFPGGPGGIRTPDQLIKSQLLCQLSYRPIYSFQRSARPFSKS